MKLKTHVETNETKSLHKNQLKREQGHKCKTWSYKITRRKQEKHFKTLASAFIFLENCNSSSNKIFGECNPILMWQSFHILWSWSLLLHEVVFQSHGSHPNLKVWGGNRYCAALLSSPWPLSSLVAGRSTASQTPLRHSLKSFQGSGFHILEIWSPGFFTPLNLPTLCTFRSYSKPFLFL